MRNHTDKCRESILEELLSVVNPETLEAYEDDETGNESLESHQSLVKARIGGDYTDAGWDAAMLQLQGLDLG